MREMEEPDMFADARKGRYKRNPLVIAGGVLTAGVLLGGLVAFRNNQQQMSQSMMRARVVFQAATVSLMLASSGMTLGELWGLRSARMGGADAAP